MSNAQVQPKLLAVTLPGWDDPGYFEPVTEVEDIDSGDYLDVPVDVEEGWQPPVQPAVSPQPAVPAEPAVAAEPAVTAEQQARPAARPAALPRARSTLNMDAVLQVRRPTDLHRYFYFYDCVRLYVLCYLGSQTRLSASARTPKMAGVLKRLGLPQSHT